MENVRGRVRRGSRERWQMGQVSVAILRLLRIRGHVLDVSDGLHFHCKGCEVQVGDFRKILKVNNYHLIYYYIHNNS